MLLGNFGNKFVNENISDYQCACFVSTDAMLEANPERRESRGKAKNFDKIESVFLLHLANVKELNKELGNSCDASFSCAKSRRQFLS